VTIQYQKILTCRTLAILFAFPNAAPFDLLGNKTISAQLSPSNNLSLWAYDNSDYYIAFLLKYVTLGITVLALIFFVVGYYAGKLVAL
jgi:hypothetical protein